MKMNATLLAEAHAIEAAGAAHAAAVCVLRLYVIGSSPRSTLAISNIRKICDEHLEGRYDLEILDISQNPALAKSEQLVAAPTLIKKWPLPVRRFVGDMSQSERILLGLDLRKEAEKESLARNPNTPCP